MATAYLLMPIFFDDPETDRNTIQALAHEVASYWNAYGAEEYGFRVFTNPDLVAEVSQIGRSVLANDFPIPPGPFKRIATLIVLAQITPLFELGTLQSTPANYRLVTDEGRYREWLPRICFLLLEPALRLVRVRGRNGQPDLPLNDWHDFPSAHSKAEFFQWLEWLRDYTNSDLMCDEEEDRLCIAKNVLACALIIENVYYQGDSPPAICGSCDDRVDLTCVLYQKVLWQNRLEDLRRRGLA